MGYNLRMVPPSIFLTMPWGVQAHRPVARSRLTLRDDFDLDPLSLISCRLECPVITCGLAWGQACLPSLPVTSDLLSCSDVPSEVPSCTVVVRALWVAGS